MSEGYTLSDEARASIKKQLAELGEGIKADLALRCIDPPLNLKSKDWKNYRRWTVLPYNCPTCGGQAFEDAWPPNYGGGSGHWDPERQTFVSTSSYGYKAVCCSCKICFRVTVQSETGKDDVVTYSTERPPLVERDGFWLTPHDVYRENYKDKHDHYPREAYG